MSTASAKVKTLRQAPRKVRLVADLVRGKSVEQALLILDFTPRKAALPVKGAIVSALANAKQKDASIEAGNLIVKSISVDQGQTLKRIRPRARGSAAPIRKKTSHINISLEVKK